MANTSGIKAGRAYVELGVSDKLTAGLKRAQKQLRTFGQGVRSIGAAIVKATAIPAAGFLISAKVFAEFDDRMRVVQAVTGATKDQFKALTAEATRLGAITSFSARQVAEAMTELGRAGFTPDAILASTDAVLNLSRATDTELARATEIAGASLRGFNLEVSDMARVTDVLTATANGSAQTLDDLFEALKPVAPIAAEAGESIEQTAAAIAVLANNGIKGSLAGNSLARAYKNLADETKQGKLREFGVEAVDAAGNLRPLSAIINDLAKSTAGLGSAKRLSIFETLFGRGQAAALKLASSGASFEALAETITNSAGDAKAAADSMDAGVGGSFRRLASATEAVGIAIGDAIKKPLAKATEAFTVVASAVRLLVVKYKDLVATAFTVIGVLGAVGIGLLAVGSLAIFASAAIGAFGTILGAVGALFGVLTSPIVLAGAAFAGFIALILTQTKLAAKAIKFLGDTFTKLGDFVGPVFAGIRDAIAGGDLELGVRIAGKGMELAWANVMVKMKSMWVEFVAFIQKKILAIGDSINKATTTVEVGLGIATGLGGGAFHGKGPRLPGGGDGFDDLIDAGAKKKIDDITDSLDGLKKELNVLIKEADTGKGEGSPIFGKLADLNKLLSAGAAGFASSGGGSVRGTFNANAVAGLSGSTSEALRTATATEKTATNTAKLIQKIQSIPGAGRFA